MFCPCSWSTQHISLFNTVHYSRVSATTLFKTKMDPKICCIQMKNVNIILRNAYQVFLWQIINKNDQKWSYICVGTQYCCYINLDSALYVGKNVLRRLQCISKLVFRLKLLLKSTWILLLLLSNPFQIQ